VTSSLIESCRTIYLGSLTTQPLVNNFEELSSLSLLYPFSVIMSFGWCVGDVISGINFLVQVYQALDESKGGKAGYSELIRELSNLRNALAEIERLGALRPDSQQSALKHAVSNCQECIEDFIGRMKKFGGWIRSKSRIIEMVSRSL
jgi:predicted CopG family antitoxin